MTATIRKVGDGIDTDVIIPGRHLTSRDPTFLGSHCMEGIDPTFANRVRKGDVLVAGRNFGCGSSREHAVLALQGCGIACVVAASYARIFFRNAINNALPVLICPEAVAVARDGEPIVVDTSTGFITLDGRTFTSEPLPEFVNAIVSSGGIVPFVRRRLHGKPE